MKKEIEVFEYLDRRARIEGININDLQKLLLAPSPSRSYGQYSIKMRDLNLLLLYDNQKNTNILIKCVKEYHDLKETDCYRIRTILGTYNDKQDKDACVNCHLKCIEKVKQGKL